MHFGRVFNIDDMGLLKWILETEIVKIKQE